MKYRFTLIALIFLVFVGSLAAQRRIDVPTSPEASPRWQCRRIVSMAPSITETLYALGLGDRVVGVTRDCHYPPEVENVKKTGNVGGYYDPNFEAIVALKPDLVIMLEEQARALPNFEKLGPGDAGRQPPDGRGDHRVVPHDRRRLRPRARRAADGTRSSGSGRSHPPANAKLCRVRACCSCSIGRTAAAIWPISTSPPTTITSTRSSTGPAGKTPIGSAAFAIRSFRRRAS